MLYLFIYLAGIIDTFRNFLESVLFFNVPVFILLCVTLIVTKLDEYVDKDFKETISKFFRASVVVLCIASFLHIFIPPKTVVYQLAGIYCGKQINQQIHIDKKLQKVSEIIDLQLDKNIKELQKESK